MRCSICIVCAALSTAALISSGCSRSTQGQDGSSGQAAVAVDVELATVGQRDLVETVEVVGSLTPLRRMMVVAQVDGVVLEIPPSPHERIEVDFQGERISEAPRLDIGVEVAAGDLLVRLDPSEHELKLRAAQARVEMVKAELAKLNAWSRPEEVRRAEAMKDRAAASHTLAEANMGRARRLWEQKAISQAEFDQASAELAAAAAALDQARAELELAKAGPTAEEIAVAQAALKQAEAEVSRSQWEMERTTIYAPYDAVVTDRYVDEGDRVTATPRMEIMELMDLSLVTARLGVPEIYIGQIQVGDLAQVYVKGSPDPVPGLVALINDKVDPTSRTFRIRVAMRNDQGRLKAGQFARVLLRVRSAPNALAIPARAISYTGGEAQVFVYGDGRVRQRAVRLGISDGDDVEVLSGLAEGEQVVTYDPSILCDGMSVRVGTAGGRTQQPASAT
jgi:HlyD family secretion protein